LSLQQERFSSSAKTRSNLRSWISPLTVDAQILQTHELLDKEQEDYSILLKKFQGSIFVRE